MTPQLINEAMQRFIHRVQPEFSVMQDTDGYDMYLYNVPVRVDADWEFVLDGVATTLLYQGHNYGYLRDSGDYWFDDFDDGPDVAEFVAALHKAADNARDLEGQMRLPL